MQISQNIKKEKKILLTKPHLVKILLPPKPVIHKYTNSIFPTFSIYLLQLSHCYPSFCHITATASFI